MTFSITKSSDFVRNEHFANDLNGLAKQFLNDNFPNFEVVSSAAHLDQASSHIHFCGQYNDNQTFSNDLINSFGKRIAFHNVQQEFNKMIRESFMVEKYKLEIGKIESKYYKHGNDLNGYKNEPNIKEKVKSDTLATKRKIIAKNTIKNFFTTTTDNNKVINSLSRELYKVNLENEAIKYMPKHFENMKKKAKEVVGIAKLNEHKLKIENSELKEKLLKAQKTVGMDKNELRLIEKEYKRTMDKNSSLTNRVKELEKQLGINQDNHNFKR